MISNEVYKFFADYVFEHSGIQYVEQDFYRLDSRINTMISNYDLETPDELFIMYKKNITADMHEFLIDLFTNNETFFMRDLKPFKALATDVLPEIIESNPHAPYVNIWSCASSTGQEIYSILMAAEHFGKGVVEKVKIDASDISTEALAKAKSGIYTGLEVQRGLPAPLLIKYFEKSTNAEEWKFKDTLRNKANFFHFNLLSGKFPESKYNIIFCRNVLIYQEKENKRKILGEICKALKVGGYLVFGAGESLIGMNLPFERVELNGATLYKKIEQL